MRSITDQVEFALNGGFTKRFHTVQTLREHTVGHHSFGVAVLCIYLSGDVKPRVELITSALFHDLAEQMVGDIPSPTKRSIPSLKIELDKYEEEFLAKYGMNIELTKEEKHMLKTADILDGMWNCIQERKLGNKGIEEAYNNFCSYALIMELDGVGQSIFNHFSNLWRKYND